MLDSLCTTYNICALWVTRSHCQLKHNTIHMHSHNTQQHNASDFGSQQIVFFCCCLNERNKDSNRALRASSISPSKLNLKPRWQKQVFCLLSSVYEYLCNHLTMRLWGLHREKRKHNSVKGLLRFLRFWMPFEGQQAPQPSFHVSQETKSPKCLK